MVFQAQGILQNFLEMYLNPQSSFANLNHMY